MTRSRETGDVGYRAYKKNLLRNGNFSVNQRNWSGPIPASGTRTLDGVVGYENTAAGDDISFNQRTSTAGDAAITNQPYDMQIDFVSSDAATSTVLFGQLIEDGVQITAGLDVSMSCKMFSAVVREISIEFIQNFGAGGSPQVRGITKKISLIAGWQDVAVTLAIPAITGKTLGDSSSLNALIWLSSGSNENASNDSLGLQPNGVVVMTSWQVEIASSATSFEYVSPQENLAACQRYYQTKGTSSEGFAQFGFGLAHGTTTVQIAFDLATTMRVLPHTINIVGATTLRTIGFVGVYDSYTRSTNTTASVATLSFIVNSAPFVEQGAVALIGNGDTTATVTFDAEL